MKTKDICSNNQTEKKILVMDFEPKVCELIALVLRGSGFNIIENRKFEDIEGLIDEEKPNLVIIDPSLGEGVCKAHFFKIFMEKVHKKTVKFLLLGPPECMKDYEELRVECLVDYCAKPFSPKELELKIHNLMGREHEKNA